MKTLWGLRGNQYSRGPEAADKGARGVAAQCTPHGSGQKARPEGARRAKGHGTESVRINQKANDSVLFL